MEESKVVETKPKVEEEEATDSRMNPVMIIAISGGVAFFIIFLLSFIYMMSFFTTTVG